MPSNVQANSQPEPYGRFVYLNLIFIKALSFRNSSLSLSPAMCFGVYGSRRSYSMVQYSKVL